MWFGPHPGHFTGTPTDHLSGGTAVFWIRESRVLQGCLKRLDRVWVPKKGLHAVVPGYRQDRRRSFCSRFFRHLSESRTINTRELLPRCVKTFVLVRKRMLPLTS